MCGIAQQGGGVEGCRHVDVAFFEKLSVLACDLEIGFDDAHGGDAAEAYASDKREAADKQAASILKQATEEADEQINERREAAKSELEGVQQRIADLQTREAQITQRVSELRAMFANAFSGFGANGLSVVNSIDGEQHESAAEAETPAESHDESGETVAGEPEVTFDEDVVSDEQQNNGDFEEPSEDEQSDQGEEAQEEQNND